jgi:hypothetical protein
MGWFSDEAKNAGAAFFGNDYLRDFQHASKTFRTDGYAYSPKFKFLFHVYFDINKTNIGSFANFPTDSNFGLAVKTIQLPKYTFETHVMNQYNRKRIVQTKLKYDPINITFHDDNNNLIRKLWYNYYTYYYKDATHVDPFSPGNAPKPGLNPSILDRNLYSNSISGNDDWGYVGENSGGNTVNGYDFDSPSKAPFFSSISIFGFNQHNFALYKLINPIVDSFNHDTYDYSQGNSVMENQMTLSYETVKYYEGALSGKNPGQIVKEFGGSEHYDTTMSPISRPGSNASIMGQGGLVDSAGGILDDLASGNWAGAAAGLGRTYNQFKGKDLGKIAASEAKAAAQNAANQTPNTRGSYKFPL